MDIKYYRKLKKNPKVFIISMQVSAILDLTNMNGFIGVTQCNADMPVYFGYLETYFMNANPATGCEIEVGVDSFEDDKIYTKEDVTAILHPVIYSELEYQTKQ